MERNLNHDDFEHFLKENADGLRMRPSDRVWNNISRDLDRKKRRFAGLFALSLLFLSSAYITYEIATINSRFTAVVEPIRLELKTASKPQATTFTSKPLPARDILKPEPAVTANRSSTHNNKRFKPATGTTATAPKKALPAPGRVTVADLDLTASVDTDLAASRSASKADLLPLSKAPDQLTQQLTATEQRSETMQERADVKGIGKRSSKLSWQVFLTPTVSYRKLSDNKAYQRPILTTGVPASVSALYGINDAVIHKPDLGLEFGVMARYAISRNVKLRTGFQFNVSRYDIKAFSFVPEVATIALNNGPRVDSVRAISNYRTSTGGRTNWLQNFYFQASVPIGLELNVANNGKIAWGMASSIQPTYLIGNRAYMITADYKNYARVPWLARRWNMNTSLETFIAINSGKTQWQVGPQVRYQILSSFIKEYPVKENLFDFGLKVGVTLR